MKMSIDIRYACASARALASLTFRMILRVLCSWDLSECLKSFIEASHAVIDILESFHG